MSIIFFSAECGMIFTCEGVAGASGNVDITDHDPAFHNCETHTCIAMCE